MSTDNYLNLQLDNTFVIIYDSEDKFREEEIGSIFIRCNNVLFIREYKNEGTENNKVPVTEKSASVEEADKSNNGEVGASGEIEVAKVELKEAEMEG